MKCFFPMFLVLSACGSAANLNPDASYPASSALARRFTQTLNSAGLVLSNFEGAPDGAPLVIDSDYTFRFINTSGIEIVYTLDSVKDEIRAYFTSPKLLRNGADIILGYSGAVFSNGVLYQADYFAQIPQNGDDANTRLMYDKKNINIVKIGINADGSLKTIAVKP